MKKIIFLIITLLLSVAVCSAKEDDSKIQKSISATSTDISPKKMEEVVDSLTIQTQNTTYMKYVRIIAAIAALIFISSTFFKGWVKGESIDFYTMLRPFVITLIILNLNSARIVVDAMVKPLDLIFTSMHENKTGEMNQLYKDYSKAKDDYIQAKNKKEENDNKNNLDKQVAYKTSLGAIKVCVETISNFFTNLDDKVLYLVLSILEWIVGLIQRIVVFTLMITSGVTRALLIIISPIVLALSIFPWFNGSIKTLVCRYVNVMLWVPLARLVGVVIFEISKVVYYNPQITIYKNAIATQNFNIETASDSIMSLSMTLIIPIIGIVLYCMVPKLSDYIIDSNGAGAVGTAITGGVTKMATAASAVAGAGTKYLAAKTLLNKK